MSDKEVEGTERIEGAESIAVRRAGRQDLAAIVRVVHKSSRSRLAVDEATAMEWLFSKGLWVATGGSGVVGVAAWQVENLVCITDLFHVAPARYRKGAGSRLLQAIEAEAGVLMCEANAMVLPAWTPRTVRTFLQGQGYEPKPFAELHRIWREVLGEWIQGEEELMVKRLRDRMVMAPI
ncbi:MAG: GNAT family N-acetyltransferase [Anaerolineaceae bacterium]|nr:GNAT family N-acetyltransferase [Anaerolineaceae bacterium]